MNRLLIITKKIIFAIVVLPTLFFAQNKKEELSAVTFEHLHLNVADMHKTAQWYVDNVDLEIIGSANKNLIYLTDKDHNYMIELSQISGLKNKYHDIDLNSFHLAFEGHKTIEKVAKKMLENGAKQQGKLYTNKVGDYVLNLKDINGFNTQLIHRSDAFYDQPVKSSIRFEHFAFNTPDQKIAALWYIQFMNLVIPWSKDIDKKKDLFRNYRVPYIGDIENRMTLELFGKDAVNSLANQPHNVIHIAFATNEPEKLAKQMIYGGAKKVGETQFLDNGDIVIDLYDQIQTPIRLIKRNKKILK